MPHLVMKVTADEYELPIAVADTWGKLGMILHENPKNMMSARSHAKARGTFTQYVKVDLDDEDGDD